MEHDVTFIWSSSASESILGGCQNDTALTSSGCLGSRRGAHTCTRALHLPSQANLNSPLAFDVHIQLSAEVSYSPILVQPTSQSSSACLQSPMDHSACMSLLLLWAAKSANPNLSPCLTETELLRRE